MLKNGQKIWTQKNGDYNTKWFRYCSLDMHTVFKIIGNPQLVPDAWIKDGQETIIGIIMCKYGHDPRKYWLFTDKTLYIRDKNGLSWMAYKNIRNVNVSFNVSSFGQTYYGLLLEINSDYGKSLFYDIKDEDICRSFDSRRVRCFLILVAKILGNCRVGFTNGERDKLAQVKLESLNGKNILEVFNL